MLRAHNVTPVRPFSRRMFTVEMTALWSSQSICALKEITGTTTQCSPRCAPWVAPHSASQTLHGRCQCARVSDRLPHKLIAQSSQWNLPCSCVGNQHGSSTPTKLAASAHVATMEHYRAECTQCGVQSKARATLWSQGARGLVYTRSIARSIQSCIQARAEVVCIRLRSSRLQWVCLHLHVWHQRAPCQRRARLRSCRKASTP
jgi:hypothetical protein